MSTEPLITKAGDVAGELLRGFSSGSIEGRIVCPRNSRLKFGTAHPAVEVPSKPNHLGK